MSLFRSLFKGKSSSRDRNTGEAGEHEAYEFLRRKSYKILDRNWKSKIGELDIVAMDGKTLVFIEVKASAKLGIVPPELRVNTAKQRKLKQLARLYILKSKITSPVRFDVIGIWWDNTVQIKHIENAFI